MFPTLAATMLRLPRTAQPRSKQGGAQQAGQTGADSPTTVVGQQQQQRSSRASKPLKRTWSTDQPAPEGHAQDVLHLLNAGW